MIYLLYGIQEYLINEKIKEIIKENNIDKYDIENYDLETTSLSNIIDSVNTVSLFMNKKLIIVDNSYIFTGANKKIDDSQINVLNDYLEHINENNILVFKVNNEKLDSRKKIVSNIKKVAEVIEFNKVPDIYSLINKMFAPYQISRTDINYLIDRVGDNLEVLTNEIEKIKIYKDQDEIITKEDILNLTCKSVDIDIFNLIDNIIMNNKEKALESYYEMLKRGEEPIKIIIMLSNQFRLIYQVKELYKKGYREYDIMDLLEQKQYPIKKASEKMQKYDSDKLLKCLYELSELDIKIKSGLIEKNIGLELFILNI